MRLDLSRLLLHIWSIMGPRSLSRPCRMRMRTGGYGRRKCRPFPPPSTGKIAVKVINHYGDEVLKVVNIPQA